MLALLVLCGCGRPATEQECQEIVERIARLELKSAPAVHPAEVDEHVQATKEAFQKRAKEQCEGKRITDEALSCVRSAQSAKEIVEECFD